MKKSGKFHVYKPFQKITSVKVSPYCGVIFLSADFCSILRRDEEDFRVLFFETLFEELEVLIGLACFPVWRRRDGAPPTMTPLLPRKIWKFS